MILPTKEIIKHKQYALLAFIIFIITGVAIIIPLAILTSIIAASAIVMGACIMTIMLLLRQDRLVAIYILAIHIYVDWYLGFAIVAPMLTILLLLIFFLIQSPHQPWRKPLALWLWSIFLVLGIAPAIHGTLMRYDATFYYPNIILGAFLMFWLGTVIARDFSCVRSFFIFLAALGTMLALLSIVQNWTGTLSFGTSRFNDYVAKFATINLLWDSNTYRIGSLFINPDWNGAFFAVILCIPLSLFVQSTSLVEKVIFLLEVLIVLPALLFTYSIGSWIAAGAAIIVFILLTGHIRYYIWIAIFFIISVPLLMQFFPVQLSMLYKHASDPLVLSLRNGAWGTALRVMQAFPLVGTGFGFEAYMQRAEPYRVAEQYKMLAHPHNSYLELGAMGGIPILIVFVVLLLLTLRRALGNWFQSDTQQRVLFSGGIAAILALSVNSLSVNAWTLPPLAAVGWLTLGVISSPLLLMQERHSNYSTSVE